MRQKNKIIFLLIHIDFRTFKYKKYCFKLGREIQRNTFKMTNIYLLRNPKAKEKQKIPLHLSHFFEKVQHLFQFFEPKNVVYKIYKKKKTNAPNFFPTSISTHFSKTKFQFILGKFNSRVNTAFLEAWFQQPLGNLLHFRWLVAEGEIGTPDLPSLFADLETRLWQDFAEGRWFVLVGTSRTRLLDSSPFFVKGKQGVNESRAKMGHTVQESYVLQGFVRGEVNSTRCREFCEDSALRERKDTARILEDLGVCYGRYLKD